LLHGRTDLWPDVNEAALLIKYGGKSNQSRWTESAVSNSDIPGNDFIEVQVAIGLRWVSVPGGPAAKQMGVK